MPTLKDHHPHAQHVSDQWSAWCRSMERLGHELLTDRFAGSDADDVEGFAHLARQVACWLDWSIGTAADPRHPAFQRQNDLVTQWGGPNVDNVYRHARVDPSLRYRITGRMHSCEEFILAVRAGFMHMERWGTLQELTASGLGIGEGQEFEILLGGDGSDPAFLPLDPGAVMVTIREYYFTWCDREPATFTIECLDADEPSSTPSADELVARLDESRSITESSLSFWNDYLVSMRSEGVRNRFRSSMRQEKGLDSARYSFCFYELGPDDALVVESDVPLARYWSLQLYSMRWFRSYDFPNRLTSLNQTQMAVDDDGRFRMVLAHADPQVPNWLDGEGRREGLLTYRWFWEEKPPTYTTTVVPLHEVRSVLPEGTPVVGASERRAVVRARRRHVAWRFRT